MYIINCECRKSGNYIVEYDDKYSDLNRQKFNLCTLSGEPLIAAGQTGDFALEKIYLGTDASKLIWTNFDLLELSDGSVFMAAGSVSQGVRQPDFV